VGSDWKEFEDEKSESWEFIWFWDIFFELENLDFFELKNSDLFLLEKFRQFFCGLDYEFYVDENKDVL
jgi:hypothetical protein